MIKKIFFVAIASLNIGNSKAQTAEALFQKLKDKLSKVNDYVATGSMKTNVAFIKAPIGKVKVYYQKPNKLKVVKEKGISILPKGGVSLNGSSILSLTDYLVVDAGETVVSGVKTKILKVLPNSENSDIVITTLYIDEANLLLKKMATTTKENGSFETEMFYGKFSNYSLPDKMIFSFNVKDYKMPKGVTLEFEDNLTKEEKEKLKVKKGKVEINFTNYVINGGVDGQVFAN